MTADTDFNALREAHPWLQTERLVAKPDQLIKRRGKLGLVKLNATYEEVQAWITERLGKTIQAGTVSGVAKCFIIEPFVPHAPTDEYYVCIQSQRAGDEVLFYHEGGVDIGDVDAKAQRHLVPVGGSLDAATVTERLLPHVPAERKPLLATFIASLYQAFVLLNFTYLEINPVVIVNNQVYYLDLAAKLDQTAEYECSKLWGPIEFPAPFGRESFPEEKYIAELDAKTGASLKLTILNPNGRIWTMVAGGGASVVYRCGGKRGRRRVAERAGGSPGRHPGYADPHPAMPSRRWALRTSWPTMASTRARRTRRRRTSTPRRSWA